MEKPPGVKGLHLGLLKNVPFNESDKGYIFKNCKMEI